MSARAPSRDDLQEWFTQLTHFAPNRFHPLVWISGDPQIGEGTTICGMSDVNGNGARLWIGAHCDIASFVSINCADSHKRCLGLQDDIERRDIFIGDHVFIGAHCVVKGGAVIGDYCVIAAGTVVEAAMIPPYSLVAGNPMQVRAGYYRDKLRALGKIAPA